MITAVTAAELRCDHDPKVWWSAIHGRVLTEQDLTDGLPSDAVRLVPETEPSIAFLVVKPGDHVLIGVQDVLTAQDGHRLAERLRDQHPDVEFTIIGRGPTLAALHEWKCPGCGATTRARMADG